MSRMQISDSDALNYLISQLAYVEKQIWEAKYAPIIYQDLIPVSYEAGSWATSVEVHYMDGVTTGKFIGAAGDDMPFVQMNTGRDVIPVRYAGIGYEYTLEELRQSMRTQTPLDTTLARLARRGFEEHAQTLLFNGDTARGLQGLLTHTGIQTSAAGSTWATLAVPATMDSFITEFNQPINTIIANTQEREIPDRYLIPVAQFNLLAGTRLNTVSDITLLQFFRQNNPSTARTGKPLEIRSVPQLSGKSLVYSSSPDVMVGHIPMPLQFVAPQPINLKIRVPGEYKLAGLEVRYPGACAYRTGI